MFAIMLGLVCRTPRVGLVALGEQSNHAHYTWRLQLFRSRCCLVAFVGGTE
jgi:hypothetical protein